MKDTIKWCIIGGTAGLANGLFGAGGGLFLVPLFIGWLKMEPKHAFATSIAVIVPLSAASLIMYWVQGGLRLTGTLPLLIGGFSGGWIAGTIFKKVPITWLRRGFGVLILYGGLRALLGL